MDATNIRYRTPYRIHQCSKCPEDAEYYCKSCSCDMCPQCKEYHLKDIQAKDHRVVLHCEKISFNTKRVTCKCLSEREKGNYGVPCSLPECNNSRTQRKHKTPDARPSYKTNRRQHKETIHTIRSEALFYRPILLTDIKTDIETCQTNFSIYQSDIFVKAWRLKKQIYKELRNFEFKHRCFEQMRKLKKKLARMQRYEHRYEQSAHNPVQILKKKTRFPQRKDILHFKLHTSQLCMTESFNTKEVTESLIGVKITERGKRRVGNDSLLKLMAGPEFDQSFTVQEGARACLHISLVTSNRVWVNSGQNLFLKNTAGATLNHLDDLLHCYTGSHTVNDESELIFIDRNNSIKKLSQDMQTTTTIKETITFRWIPQCVCCSSSTGNLLVGMYHIYLKIGKLVQYNKSGQLTQTIPHYDTVHKLYKRPIYITENSNGDVVVSDDDFDYGAVVVTDFGGRHRFSYRGPPSGSALLPRGICTDALSHILVCDISTNTVQMLDKDGQFLSHVLIRPPGIFSAHSLSYDFNTDRLWVGAEYTNKLCVYRFLCRHHALTAIPKSRSRIQLTETKTLQKGNEHLLKLMSDPGHHQFVIETGVDGCYHISYVTSDRVWVSDIKNNLLLHNTAGDTLYHLKDLCNGKILTGKGPHTVNIEGELIYIDKNHNIKKMSKDMKTNTTFLDRIDYTWEPQCVYWSLSGNLLVGMYRDLTETGKVTKYNQDGQLTKKIQYDKNGLALYNKPLYITENNNGDIVVSDCLSASGAVVVTKRGGNHRFSYTGHSPGSNLQPTGICTDALSHILVCDNSTHTVQVINRNGEFLSKLLTESNTWPWSLSYDVNSHHLWVGSWLNNKLWVYKYIDRQYALTGHR